MIPFSGMGGSCTREFLIRICFRLFNGVPRRVGKHCHGYHILSMHLALVLFTCTNLFLSLHCRMVG